MTHRAAAAALAITALLALPAVGTPQVPASKVKVGICADPDRFDAAQAVGFDYIEINASKTAALSEEEFAQLVERVKALKIPVEAANVFIPAAIKLVGPEVDTARQESYAASTLARLKALGVKVLVLGSGGARRVPDGFSRDEAFAQLVDFCRRLAPIAGRNGITIAIEPLRRQESNIINTAREGLALAKAVDRPEIKLLVDYYHLSQEAESADVLKEAGRFLVHTHVANPAGRVYPLDPAESDYGPFFANLCAIGYSGRISIEASTKDFAADAPKALAMLRKAVACTVPVGN